MNERSPSLFKSIVLAGTALALGAQICAADSLWRDDASRSMFADKRGHATGDIITIVVQESNATTKENSTKTSRQTGMDASIASFLYGPAASGLLTKGGKYPALKMNSKNDFDGGGQINNSEKMNARIAVTVMDVLPNGQMLIEGRKNTAFSGEKQEAVLRGKIRSEDVTANNTVFSYNVADASIQFVSKGTISDNQRKGWFFRAWEKISPF
jgi:flagellar L-ring protein precursor FlgH